MQKPDDMRSGAVRGQWGRSRNTEFLRRLPLFALPEDGTEPFDELLRKLEGVEVPEGPERSSAPTAVPDRE